MINVFQPSLGEEELKRIESVFKSNWLGKGKLTAEFESQFADYLHVAGKQVRSTNCCSEGLWNSMELFDFQEGDEIILPSISFVGTGNSICAHKLKPVFCDVNERTLNVTAENIEEKITPKTKAVVLIHYGGVPCDMDPILNLAEKYHLRVIEDSACSVSSTYKGRACGTLGDMGMWSFDAMKVLVCADGAALYFKDPEIANRAEKLMYFGLESKSGYSNSVDSKWWEFEISCFGHRSIMNDVTAAMALEQLKKLPSFIDRRKEIHDIYSKELGTEDWLKIPENIPDDCTSTYYFYHIQMEKEEDRDLLAAYLRKNEIYTTFRYYPLHWVKLYGATEKLPNTEKAARETLCLPIHQSLSNEEVYYIIEKIKEFKKADR